MDRETVMREEMEGAVKSLKKVVELGSEVDFSTLTHAEAGLLIAATYALEKLAFVY